MEKKGGQQQGVADSAALLALDLCQVVITLCNVVM